MIGGGFQNIFKIPELKKRILFTLALLIVYRIGVHVPVPGIDSMALASFFKQAEGTIFGIVNMFSGGAFERLSVFALGIMPYISASIILQLLTVVIPHLEQLKKEVWLTPPHWYKPGYSRVKETGSNFWGMGKLNILWMLR